MRRILHDLDLAIFLCNVSILNLESALDVGASELSDIDAVLQNGLQLALDDLRAGPLLSALIHQN